MLGVGLALAALGWGLDTQTRVETDISRLVPQSLSSLQNLEQLERATGVGGEIDLIVSGNSVASPATIEWMSTYQSTVLRRFGYTATRGCGVARLCPAFSLPDLFAGQAPAVDEQVGPQQVAVQPHRCSLPRRHLQRALPGGGGRVGVDDVPRRLDRGTRDGVEFAERPAPAARRPGGGLDPA